MALRRISSRVASGSGGSCRGCALAMLARRARSEEEVRRKLIERGFPDDEIAAAVSDLVETGALDEAPTAEIFVRLRRNRWGRERLELELRKRFFKEETIRGALEGFGPEEEFNLARRLAGGPSPRRPDPGERRRIFAMLRRKGISASVAIRFVGPEPEGDG